MARTRVLVPCTTCGEAFLKEPWTIRPHNFCGRPCMLVWRRSGIFAGPKNPAWLGGNSDYRGGNWAALRAAARARDGDTCQHCGRRGANLPVHHIRPYHLFARAEDANVLSNLLTLCKRCHTKADNAFWRQHPELLTSRRVPDLGEMMQTCRVCGGTFMARSAFAKVCDVCCTHQCAHCGQAFYSRKAVHRAVKYCSRACRNAAIKLPEQTCAGCGVTYQPDRLGTRFCSQPCRMKHDQPYKYRRIFLQKPATD